jgi:SAM-dependent methyltransferase
MTDYTYVGAELDLFAAATNWKSYLYRQVAPYLGREVLEVGAGFGGTTKVLCRGEHASWTCLEPDAGLAGRLADSIGAGDLPRCCRAEVGTLADLPAGAEYDAILYIDVLEHIEDDAGEMARAAGHVRPGGCVVVLSPAQPWLFTPFDTALGHFRRYTRRSLLAVAPPGLTLARMIYLDSVGMLASLGNRLMLRQSTPNAGQIAVWDRLMVPASRVLDPLLAHATGRSILGVWRRPATR